LAFAIPLIHHILLDKETDAEDIPASEAEDEDDDDVKNNDDDDDDAQPSRGNGVENCIS